MGILEGVADLATVQNNAKFHLQDHSEGTSSVAFKVLIVNFYIRV